MNVRRSGREKIVVGHDELKRFIHDVFVVAGASDVDADTVADGLVWANLRGVDGHGISRLPRYLKYVEQRRDRREGAADAHRRPRRDLRHRRPSRFRAGRGDAGLGARRGAGEASRRLLTASSARPRTPAPIGRYAQWIAERDCAAIIMAAGPTLMAYHGARVASLGTSPIAIAVPTSNGPIVLDMATSTISNGKILQARATGEPLPEGTVLTADGRSRPPIRARRKSCCRSAAPRARV